MKINILLRICTFVFFFMPLGRLHAAANKTPPKIIRVASPDSWCPIVCQKENLSGERLGFAIDMATEIFKMHNIKLELVAMPYTRALAEVKAGRLDAIPSAYKDEAPGFVFPAEPILKADICFFTNQNTQWTYSKPADISKLSKPIAVVESYSYGKELDKYILENPNYFEKIKGENAVERMMELVKLGRAFSFSDDYALIFWKMHNNKKLQFRNAGCATSIFSYFALSPENPYSAQYSEYFSSGIKILRQNGTVEKIMKRYGLHDWK